MQPTIQVASLGMWDSLILMVMALVVFGPRRLPEIGRKAGRIMYELRKASNDFKFQMEEELRKVDEADLRKKEEARLAAVALAAPADPQLLEAGSETPSAQISDSETSKVYGPAAVESPYPGETVYPAVIAAEAETPAEETVPGTQPISTSKTEPTAQVTPTAEAQTNIAANETPATEQAPHD